MSLEQVTTRMAVNNATDLVDVSNHCALWIEIYRRRLFLIPADCFMI